MRRVEKHEIRVVVEPNEPWLILDKSPEARERALLAAAESIKSAIIRHVDDVAGVAVSWDLVTVCDHLYGEVEGDGNLLDRWPSCCSEDQKEFALNHITESDDWFVERGCDDLEWLKEIREGADRG